ncbi:MAG: glycosyltransferase family 39 protein [Oscillospiraceae bacterium]|nr:glycosyltransferase family 39 protein [Oscillospiraceae bacterium]
MISKKKERTWLFAGIFAAIWVFLFWKCRFGIANLDEAFYLTVPYRFCQGDLPLLHEWHLSQTSGLLLTPIMKLYLSVFGGTEGILLRFRWIFTAIWGLGALFLYRRLRVFSHHGAMAAALIFLIYTPFGMMALSYNTMGLLLLLCSCTVLASVREHIWLQQFLAGVLFAGAVLCCPYLLLAYALFCITAFLGLAFQKRSLASLWLFFSFGAATVCALVCVPLLLNAPLRRYLEVFPYMLEDPEHELVSLWSKIKLYVYFTATSSPLLIPFGVLFIPVALYCSRRKKHLEGFVFVCIQIVALLFWYLIREHFPNHLMFPLCLIGLYCAICSRDVEIRKLFLVVWLPGLAYSFCLNLSSNQLFFAVSSASTVMTVASAVMAARFLEVESFTEKGSRNLRKTAALFFTAVIFLQLGAELYIRYDQIYWDDAGIRAQKHEALSGPEMGIRMNDEDLNEYSRAMSDFLLLENRQWKTAPEADREDRKLPENSGKILFLSEKTWSYLGTKMRNASYSAWISGLNENTIPRLKKYYALFPEQEPELILVGPYYPALTAELQGLGYERLSIESNYYTFLQRGDSAKW